MPRLNVLYALDPTRKSSNVNSQSVFPSGQAVPTILSAVASKKIWLSAAMSAFRDSARATNAAIRSAWYQSSASSTASHCPRASAMARFIPIGLPQFSLFLSARRRGSSRSSALMRSRDESVEASSTTITSILRIV